MQSLQSLWLILKYFVAPDNVKMSKLLKCQKQEQQQPFMDFHWFMGTILYSNIFRSQIDKNISEDSDIWLPQPWQRLIHWTI